MAKETARELWITGALPIDDLPNFTEGSYARRYAIECGIPAACIKMLATSSTWEDGFQIAKSVRETSPESITIVTGWYHARRTLQVLDYHLSSSDVKVYYSPSPCEYTSNDWWRHEEGLVLVFNEVLKTSLYWKRYGLSPFSYKERGRA